MAIYREGYHAIELIEENSVQIFPDACDFGAPVRKGDEIWNRSKQLIDWWIIRSKLLSRKIRRLRLAE